MWGHVDWKEEGQWTTSGQQLQELIYSAATLCQSADGVSLVRTLSRLRLAQPRTETSYVKWLDASKGWALQKTAASLALCKLREIRISSGRGYLALTLHPTSDNGISITLSYYCITID
jgi:hypothetical protein